MKTQHNQKGFTLIELIVVIAIMGIIGAVLVPQFATMSLRSRMSTDVSTTKTVQNQAEIFFADTGAWPESTADNIVSVLASTSYLDPKYLANSSTLKFQTSGATLQYDSASSFLYVSVAASDYNKFNANSDKGVWIRSN
ncbi:type II secretion system protein [Cellulosilyticum lentocellum]|uniref:Prepilin-type N-terminal cleavage/methylation domain-containing protein n=1 Tax=Cellulosilyticum lentocellum (strain ATCC 49066 / DSM 5427 / NCIMB 11756 / RHM5) TaxID=642492 RepID=F2JMC5_CELLD|nr:type II secretion system protein [Cellulosilyticum lentocellum]ADZ83443.1 hypothetical protein Clole_1719 [Cellulosilyticum lentocellum DSM 5427]